MTYFYVIVGHYDDDGDDDKTTVIVWCALCYDIIVMQCSAMLVDVISHTETDSCSVSWPVAADACRTAAEFSCKNCHT